MNNLVIKFKIILAIVLLNLSVTAQTYADDSQLWMHVRLQKEITKKIDLNLKLQGRMTNSASELGRASANFKIKYKIHKNIKLMAGYVFIEKKNNRGVYKTRHSYYGAIELKKEIRRFKFIYRNLFMCRYKSPFTSYDGYIAYYYDRNRVTIEYEYSKRFSFYIMEDVNMPINNPQLKGFSRSRSFVGTNITINKHQKLELYAMYHLQLQQGDWFEQDISYSNKPMTRYLAIGIGYNINF